MSSDVDPSSDPGTNDDPYALLGLNQGASFDEVQKARDKKLAEIGNDSRARAKVEASYDAVLMSSLKERQLGKASNEALSASRLEENQRTYLDGNPKNNSFFKNINLNNLFKAFPSFSLPDTNGIIIRIILGLITILLVIVSPEETIDLILSFSTIALFISQVRKGNSALSSLAWSILLLCIGLLLGGLISSASSGQPELTRLLSKEQLEALPAVLLIWSGSILL